MRLVKRWPVCGRWASGADRQAVSGRQTGRRAMWGRQAVFLADRAWQECANLLKDSIFTFIRIAFLPFLDLGN